jgi:periplasmic divalent cation tolerance protein
MVPYRLLYITVADDAAGRALARRLVEERLAACTHLLPAGRSFYWWEGDLVESAELVLIAKTRADLTQTAIETIAGWHDYDCPCILSLPIDDGHPPFLAWISDQTRAG